VCFLTGSPSGRVFEVALILNGGHLSKSPWLQCLVNRPCGAAPHGRWACRPASTPTRASPLPKAGFDVDDDGKNCFHIVTGLRINSVTKIQDDLGLRQWHVPRGPDTNGDYMDTLTSVPTSSKTHSFVIRLASLQPAS
jgi:hypothetical protein